MAVVWMGAALSACEGSDADTDADGGPDGGGLDGGPTAAVAAPLEVTVEQGVVVGRVEEGARLFLGIPYAKPPVGERRFAPPEPVDPWDEKLEATEYGTSCPQPDGSLAVMNERGEDCLNLNVLTPVNESAQPRPVMVWIHGGAYYAGGSSQYSEAVTLVDVGDLIVVTVNYRLGALGFLAHGALDAEGAPSGNAGLRDQQLALRWVRDNIAAFGGDPNAVTVFGESAGGSSVCLQMFARGSEQLAQGYIIESGACIAGALRPKDREAAVEQGEALADELCAGEAEVGDCLRGLDVESLLGWRADVGTFGAGWGPNIDGAQGLLPQPPDAMLQSGDYNSAPLLLGGNSDEWGLFLLLGDPAPTTVEQFDTAIADVFPDHADEIAEFYAPATDADATLAYSAALSDSAFRCPIRTLARDAAGHGAPVYLYSFDVAPGYHALELDYVFGRDTLSPRLGSTKDEALGDAIQAYWTAFSTTGDPNSEGLPSWPVHSMQSDAYLELAADIEPSTGFSGEACDRWDAWLPRR